MSQVTVSVSTSKKIAHIPSEVRFKHLRTVAIDYLSMEEEIYNKGGITVAYRYLSSEELLELLGVDTIPAIIVGFAGCSWADNFSRHMGRRIALERLATSEVIIAGEDSITKLMTASEPYQVQDVITGPMAVQGIRFELCA
ncbi:hypothetical protein [Pseudomonas sp. P8_250]|uniref:hypothetical protein n=1 Tax=Pseudomonas sp. P8_250 TaxID=3043446 RepID=UPI002A36D867|nr:hypothetical protein [Pseudomonas sp. P8_250]MDX9668745.1 hypothetical protein [Pseudomonas sp. P8_250]